MVQKSVRVSYFSKDIEHFIRLLSKYSVKYLIIGGEAVIHYGHARLTGDKALSYISYFYQFLFHFHGK